MQYPKDNNDTLHFLKMLDQYTLMLLVFLLTGRFLKYFLTISMYLVRVRK